MAKLWSLAIHAAPVVQLLPAQRKPITPSRQGVEGVVDDFPKTEFVKFPVSPHVKDGHPTIALKLERAVAEDFGEKFNQFRIIVCHRLVPREFLRGTCRIV